MRRRQADELLAAANPVETAGVKALPLASLGDDSLAELIGELPPEQVGGSSVPRARRLRASYALALAGSALLVVASLLTIVWSPGGGPNGRPRVAYGTELVRFANESPLVLLEAPGWRVEGVLQASRREGEIHFVHADERADFFWRRQPLRLWLRDRAVSADRQTTAPVLGTRARVFRYAGGGPGAGDFTALWREEGRVLEFRSPAPGMAAFAERLAALERVRAAEWLDALPRSVVKAAEHDRAVREMLAGIPLPPGFTAANVEDPGLTNDRRLVAVYVVGAVVCAWHAQWAEGQRERDPAQVRRAVAAIASARRWPVVEEMNAHDAIPQVLAESARLLRDGHWNWQCSQFR